MTLRLTFYSALAGRTGAWWWRGILRPLSVVPAAIGWVNVQLALVLATGRWAHVYAGLLEFVPLVSKYAHRVPPVLFEGEVRHATSCPVCGAVNERSNED